MGKEAKPQLPFRWIGSLLGNPEDSKEGEWCNLISLF
jgi:hypothetical protein